MLVELLQEKGTLFSSLNQKAPFQGLYFIHHSWIRAHGRLSSSKCLINSRFMVKLTDYALRNVLPETVFSGADSEELEQLWMAPEQLRSQKSFDAAARRRADVYSLSIIMSGVCLLSAPLAMYDGDIKLKGGKIVTARS